MHATDPYKKRVNAHFELCMQLHNFNPDLYLKSALVQKYIKA